MSGTRPLPDEANASRDYFFHGRVQVLQNRRGYRFSVDAPLLADFIRTAASDDILELGTGSGIISLLLSVKPFRKITALEIQPGLADLARRNVVLNGLQDRIEIVRADLTVYEAGKKFDLIFSNPPYIKRGAGLLSMTGEKAAARHEVFCLLEDVLDRTAAWLKPEGRACFIFPERRRRDFTAAALERGLSVKRLRPVMPRADGEPNLFLVELALTPGAAEELEPLILFRGDGGYTEEAEAVFAGRR